MDQTWIVVALVQVFEDGGKDEWIFLVQSQAFLRAEELLFQRLGEPRRPRKNVLMRCEQPLVLANGNRDDCAVELRRTSAYRRRSVGCNCLGCELLADTFRCIFFEAPLADFLHASFLLSSGEAALKHLAKSGLEFVLDAGQD